MSQAGAEPDRLSVLVVDGDRRVRAGLTRLMSAACRGWEVRASAEPATAAALVAEAAPQLAVVNIAEDQHASLDLIRCMSSRGVAVVALCDMSGHGLAAAACGAVTAVTKDSGADALLTAVRDVAERIERVAAEGQSSAMSASTSQLSTSRVIPREIR